MVTLEFEYGEPGTFDHIDGLYYVSVVERDRVCGGAEEGGWWYDYDTPVFSYPFSVPEAALSFAEKMREVFYISTLKTGDEYDPHRDVYSVNYTGGDHSVWVDDEPAPQPTYQHYE